MRYGSSPFGGMTPVVKNLIIINALFFVASIVFQSSFGIRIEDYLGLHVPMAEKFQPYQLISYMFLHAYPSLTHIFFNMFALFMFGRMLEMVWGPKKFLIYYFATGIGAAIIQVGTQYFEIMPMLQDINTAINNPSYENLKIFFNIEPHQTISAEVARESLLQFRTAYLNAQVTVGASGSVFGILLAFGMLFPNTQLMLLFPPIPIKAKWLVIIYGVMELFLGVANFSFDNVAHFAHLGGMLFGFFLIKYWQRKGNLY